MIIGAHTVIYSTDPEADQRFFRDVLRLPAVDGGGGYLILGLPPAEASVHPASKDNLQYALYLLCDNITDPGDLARLRFGDQRRREKGYGHHKTELSDRRWYTGNPRVVMTVAHTACLPNKAPNARVPREC